MVEIGVAEIENTRRQKKRTAILLDVAQALQREQYTSCARTREPVRAATSDSVCDGAPAENERITASPRAKDCT